MGSPIRAAPFPDWGVRGGVDQPWAVGQVNVLIFFINLTATYTVASYVQ